MSNIIILFGEMGGGKNYHGEKIANQYGYQFFDGDNAVTAEMSEKVSRFKPISREIIETYVNQLCSTIVEQARYSNLVVAQALYSDRDRRYLYNILSCLGHNVYFRWVKTPFIQNMKQIYSRPNGFRWVLYWLMNKPFFQKPSHRYKVVK